MRSRPRSPRKAGRLHRRAADPRRRRDADVSRLGAAEMKRICEASEVLFIADEVMTGWGRTGTLFACEQADVTPDIACYSKGPHGWIVAAGGDAVPARRFSTRIFRRDRTRTFFHSSSYTANPIACAAARPISIWGRTRRSVARRRRRGDAGAGHCAPFRADPRFKNVRRTGTITALELEARDSGYLAGIGPKLQAFFGAATCCCVRSAIRSM